LPQAGAEHQCHPLVEERSVQADNCWVPEHSKMALSDLNSNRELLALAGQLSSRPITPDSYKLDELLSGLDIERHRLNEGPILALLFQQLYVSYLIVSNRYRRRRHTWI